MQDTASALSQRACYSTRKRHSRYSFLSWNGLPAASRLIKEFAGKVGNSTFRGVGSVSGEQIKRWHRGDRERCLPLCGEFGPRRLKRGSGYDKKADPGRNRLHSSSPLARMPAPGHLLYVKSKAVRHRRYRLLPWSPPPLMPWIAASAWRGIGSHGH